MAQFFNTLSGKLEKFEKETGAQVGVYTCGPTVYDYAHIGNFRAFVFEDLLRRFLEFKNYKVKHVMNVTDVDDKTIAGAQREKMKLEDYTATYIKAFNEDLKTLNCLAPTVQPRATQKIKQMLDLIQKLIHKGAAYENGGSVYFRVSKFAGYGKLSKKKLEMNITGASERIESDEYESKETATDFVLWKAAKEGEAELGAAWDSPWGKGRPGWHIECSAMSIEELGEQFDIHAGGEDLIFPHHENEIAQSEGATGKDPFVKYWLHCKFLLVDGAKMSKSKGNFYTLRDLLAKGHDPMAIRYALLSTHYRNTLNFSTEGMRECEDAIKRLRETYFECLNRKQLKRFSQGPAEPALNLVEILKDIQIRIVGSLSEDLSVSKAFAGISEAIKNINLALAPGFTTETNIEAALNFIKTVDQLLGFKIAIMETLPEDIFEMLLSYSESKKNKNFPEVDKVREKLKSLNWNVKDYAIKPGMIATSGFADKVGATFFPSQKYYADLLTSK